MLARRLSLWNSRRCRSKLIENQASILERNKMEDGKARWPPLFLCGLPPIEQKTQKTLDGWGLRCSHIKGIWACIS
jgi:hypothetical protein